MNNIEKEINLEVKTRDKAKKKLKEYRQKGIIPAILYGKNIKNVNLWLDLMNFNKVFQEVGENTILNLIVDKKKSVPVLIHDIQYDYISNKPIHVDFFQVKMDEKIETEVPLEFTDEAPAVKELGGVLVVNINEIPVRCLPSDIPSKFILSLKTLKTFEDRLLVKDIKFDKNKVEILMEDENIIALVSPPRSQEELEALEEKVEEDVTQVKEADKKEEVSETKENKKEE